MGTLLENNNNINFMRKCEMTFIVSTSLYDLKVLVPLPWLTMGFQPP